MRARSLLVTGLALAAPLACVDLFHSTDFADTQAGEAGVGGDAGADADAGPTPIDFCAWSSDEAAEVAERTCARLGACGGPLGQTSFAECVRQARWTFDCQLNPHLRPRGRAHDLWACLSSASTCQDVSACVYQGAAPTCQGVPEGGSFTRCATGADKAVRVHCGSTDDGPPIGTEPCALSGQTCEALDPSESVCVGAPGCSSQGRRCDGTVARDCAETASKSFVDLGRDCATVGDGACVSQALVVSKSIIVGCKPSSEAPSCEGTTPVTCERDGGVATACIDGRKVEVACAAILGVRCDVVGAPLYAPHDACKGLKALDGGICPADRCSGSTIISCSNGVTLAYDCQENGYAGCRVGPGGHAACTVP